MFYNIDHCKWFWFTEKRADKWRSILQKFAFWHLIKRCLQGFLNREHSHSFRLFYESGNGELTFDVLGLNRFVNLLLSLIRFPSLYVPLRVPCGLTDCDKVCGIGHVSSIDRFIPRLLLKLPTFTENATINYLYYIHKYIYIYFSDLNS